MKRRRKRQVSPRNMKKHSTIVQQRSANDIVVQGDREETEVGYIIKGFEGKHFETFWEVILDGNASALVRHPAKEKVIRVISGAGYAILFKEDEKGKTTTEEIKLNAGDEVVLEPDVAYRLSATSTPLEFFGIQAHKYNKRLHVVEPPVVSTEVTVDAFLWNKRDDLEPVAQRRMNSSKAVDQQRNEAKSKGRNVSTAYIPSTGGEQAGLNPKPGGGRQFDEAGAG